MAGRALKLLAKQSILFALLLASNFPALLEATNDSNDLSGNRSGRTMLPRPASRIRDEPESVWVEFIQLALEHKPLNLGQGFPDFAAPKYLVDALHNATSVDGLDRLAGEESQQKQVLNNQYTRSFGHPRLVRALLAYYRDLRNFTNLSEANQQVLVTVGAYEAIFATIMAFVEVGDEVIIVDPAFDAYAPIVKMAQGKQVFVPLRLAGGSSAGNNGSRSSAEYRLDMEELRAKVSARTRLLVLNTPNNPLGKMYSRAELQEIGQLCIEHNILVLADEVYEQMFYPPEEHVSIASLPGMWERTITVGSAGKTFSVTGWKVGWALGPSELVRYLQLVHQTAIYTVATPLQEAIARALEHEIGLIKSGKRSYWDDLRAELEQKRNRMAAILERAHMRPIVPQGGYFMLADFSPLARQHPEYRREGMAANKSASNDYLFARWLSRAKKLQGIPASAFYSAPNKRLASDLVRFCFIKRTETLDRLEQLLDGLQGSGGSEAAQTGAANNATPRSKL